MLVKIKYPGCAHKIPLTPLSLHFGFSIILVFGRFLFFAFFGVLSGDLWFFYSHQHLHSPSFLNCFLSVSHWAP